LKLKQTISFDEIPDLDKEKSICIMLHCVTGKVEDAISFLEFWIGASHRYRMTVPFSHQVFEELTQTVKNTKDPELWERYVRLCTKLEELVLLAEASMLDIVAR
jgi:hypothetical protein